MPHNSRPLIWNTFKSILQKQTDGPRFQTLNFYKDCDRMNSRCSVLYTVSKSSQITMNNLMYILAYLQQYPNFVMRTATTCTKMSDRILSVLVWWMLMLQWLAISVWSMFDPVSCKNKFIAFCLHFTLSGLYLVNFLTQFTSTNIKTEFLSLWVARGCHSQHYL